MITGRRLRIDPISPIKYNIIIEITFPIELDLAWFDWSK